MTLREQVEALLKEHKPSEVVKELVRVCAERATETEREERLGWRETAYALDVSLDRITSYGK